MAWLNLTMPNQTVKNGLKAKKIKLPQMNNLPEKQPIKFSWTYWPLSSCKILKKFLGPILSYEDVPFSSAKWPICHEQNFFGTNHYYFHLPIGPFQCAKFYKNSYSESRVIRMRHFWAPNGSFAPNNSFLKQKNYHLHLPIGPFHSAKFLKNS